jgi:hypothetical protein
VQVARRGLVVGGRLFKLAAHFLPEAVGQSQGGIVSDHRFFHELSAQAREIADSLETRDIA